MTRQHVPELDGLRGIAVLLVLMVHFGDYDPTSQIPLANLVRAGFAFGWVGVDLFFVLSGCLITGILLEAKGTPGYFRNFYARRALRILPLYYAMVLGYFWIFLPRGVHASEQVWYWTYLANWRIAFDPDAAPALSHFWSLAIEEQFYLVWPLVVFFVSERALRAIALGLILAALGLRNIAAFQQMQVQYQQFLYVLTPFRVDSLAFGALAAMLLRRRMSTRWLGGACAAGVVALGAIVAVGRSVRPFSKLMSVWGFTAIGVVCMTAVLYACLKRSESLRNPILRSFGKYSYAIYVFHWPLSIWINEFLRTRVLWAGGLGAALVSMVVGTAASFGMAWVSWNVMEKHFLKWKACFNGA